MPKQPEARGSLANHATAAEIWQHHQNDAPQLSHSFAGGNQALAVLSMPEGSMPTEDDEYKAALVIAGVLDDVEAAREVLAMLGISEDGLRQSREVRDK